MVTVQDGYNSPSWEMLENCCYKYDTSHDKMKEEADGS